MSCRSKAQPRQQCVRPLITAGRKLIDDLRTAFAFKTVAILPSERFAERVDRRLHGSSRGIEIRFVGFIQRVDQQQERCIGCLRRGLRCTDQHFGTYLTKTKLTGDF